MEVIRVNENTVVAVLTQGYMKRTFNMSIDELYKDMEKTMNVLALTLEITQRDFNVGYGDNPIMSLVVPKNIETDNAYVVVGNEGAVPHKEDLNEYTHDIQLFVVLCVKYAKAHTVNVKPVAQAKPVETKPAAQATKTIEDILDSTLKGVTLTRFKTMNDLLDCYNALSDVLDLLTTIKVYHHNDDVYLECRGCTGPIKDILSQYGKDVRWTYIQHLEEICTATTLKGGE